MSAARKHLWLLLTPWALFFLGIVLNILVISANGGMPVVVPQTWNPNKVRDTVHMVAISTDHLWYLIDWIFIPGVGVASIGDLFLWLGDWLKIPGLAAYFALVLFSE